MAQHDFNIANQLFPATRTDLNNALQALVSQSSGATAPSATFANQIWYDTASNILKMRNEADDAWISKFYIDQSSGTVRLIENTDVYDGSGVVARIGVHSGATWIAGSNTSKRLVSPAQIKAQILDTLEWDFVDDVYDFSVDGAAAVAETSNFAANYDYGFWFDGLGHADGAGKVLSANAYHGTDAAWSGANMLNANIPDASTATGGFFAVYRPMEGLRSVSCRWEGQLARTNLNTPLEEIGNDQFDGDATPQQRTKMRFRLDAGLTNFNAGKISMFKRKAFY